MIELEGLTKRFGSKVAVDHLTFSVRPGVVTGFLGPNGAGKSTTMRMMLGLDAPTSGHVRIDGKRYDHLQEPLNYIGALLEAKSVHGGRTAYNHLLCLAQSNGIAKRRVSEVLDLVGLSGVAKKRPKGFSLGMGQRLGIAQALLGDPQILMFDEPVNGLDPEGIHWIRNLMQELARQGRTVFVSSHLMSEMALTAEHLVVIGQGKLLADTPMSEFIAKNSRTYVRLRTPEPEKLRDLLHGEGVKPSTAADGSLEAEGVEASRIGELAAREGLVLHELSPQQASLEEAFMRLTAGAVEYHAHTAGEPGVPGAAGAPAETQAAGAGAPSAADAPSQAAPPQAAPPPPTAADAPQERRPAWGEGWKKGR